MNFRPGDRVKMLIDYGEDSSPYATYLGPYHYDEREALVTREDGLRGGGSRGEWIIPHKYLAKVDPPRIEPAQHVMGLSPETIDPEKYKAFMRELQS